MGSLLHLHDAHQRAQMLLPWYANGTLESAERALLDAHLADCAECREDLAGEQALRAELASLPSPAVPEPRRAGRALPDVRPRYASRHRFLARRVPLGWALVPAAAAAAVALYVLLPPDSPVTDGGYRLLGSEAVAPAGNVIVMFAPEATAREMRDTLDAAGARVVDGPTASGAYLVHVPAAGRPAALERLRARPEVVLAEPVDPGGTP